jgi:transposase
MKENTLCEFKAFVGLDWADKKHDICIQAAESSEREFYQIQHTVDDIEQWAYSLRARFNGRIAVAVELSKGPIVYALQQFDFITIFPVNPTTLARYRNTFTLSAAKDDPTDAEFALELMLRYPDKVLPLTPQSENMRKLTYLVRSRRKLVEDRRRLANRLIATLKQYYPQVLDWFSHKNTQLFCDFILRWPSLQELKKARKQSIVKLFKSSSGRTSPLIEKRLQAIKSARPLTEDRAVISAHRLEAMALAAQMLAIIHAIKVFDVEILSTFKALPDCPIFSGLPGAGPCLAPRLLVAFGEDRSRYKSAAEIQQYAGIAPVTERSGKRSWIHWRWQCSKFLRQTFVEWSAKTVSQSYWAGVYYQNQRDKGKSHQAAVRSLAFKWIRILYACWQSKTPYNETRYLNQLRERSSPIIV